MNYRDFSVKSKLIITLFQTEIISLDFTISLFQKKERIFLKYFFVDSLTRIYPA